MLVVDFDPTRDREKGQLHVRLIDTASGDYGNDAKHQSQVGYWCDLGHLENGIIRPAQHAFEGVSIQDGEERPADTVRRFAARLVKLEEMVDAEIERVRRTDDLTTAGRFNFLRRRWIDGVRTARAVSENRLWKIKSAFYDFGQGGDEGVHDA